MTATAPIRVSEADFQQAITDICDLLHLPWAHVRNSQGSHVEGLPDLLIVDWPHATVRAWELKSRRGSVREAQAWWLERMAGCSAFQSGLYRPQDEDDLIALLGGERLQR